MIEEVKASMSLRLLSLTKQNVAKRAKLKISKEGLLFYTFGEQKDHMQMDCIRIGVGIIYPQQPKFPNENYYTYNCLLFCESCMYNFFLVNHVCIIVYQVQHHLFFLVENYNIFDHMYASTGFSCTYMQQSKVNELTTNTKQ